jgi:hypothetical protein
MTKMIGSGKLTAKKETQGAHSRIRASVSSRRAIFPDVNVADIFWLTVGPNSLLRSYVC